MKSITKKVKKSNRIITEELRMRQRAVEYAIKINNNAKAAIKYKTNRVQIHRWRKRYDGTITSLMPRSRRPHLHPKAHRKEEIELILNKYRRYKFEGLAEVYMKSKEDGYTRSYDSMCKIIRRINKREEKIKRIRIKSNYVVERATYPGERVQVDIKYIPRESIKFARGDMNYYQITAIDEYSRKRVLKVVDEKSNYHTSVFVKRLEELMGFKIDKIQTDNGKEFTNGEDKRKSLFEKTLEAMGIIHQKTRIYSPWQNGKVERSHREDSKYYLGRVFRSIEELKRGVKKYCSRYNNIRRKVLNFKSPNEVVREYQNSLTN
ncbi:IS481 family transposase [Streptobacillus moniliformis]|uniref:IS481 family transposase n=1 Tax=Streptobacillus moniliformis TaxID=34105 RepID=UPI0007E4C4CA|nr:IS481 family transposase [Streptobacillus moniliformis]